MKDFQSDLQEQMAFDLQCQHGVNFDFAWVSHQEKVYYSRYPKNLQGPASAIVKLIQFLFDQHVDHSFFILRNRIFSTAQISPMCEGMVQLAAKRVTGEIQAKDHGLKTSLEIVEMGDEALHILQSQHLVQVDWQAPQKIEDPIEAYFHLQNMIAKIPRGDVLHDFNRQIAGLICAPNGQVLSWAVNSNYKNKTLHAEVVAIQKYFSETGKKLPTGSVIYTSLKPCRMCAGMLTQLAEDPDQLKAIYFQDDPGPLAKNTELEKRQRLQHYLLQDESR
jgi:cytidine deaminase